MKNILVRLKRIVKTVVYKVGKWILRPLLDKLDRQEEQIRLAAEYNVATRTLVKQLRKDPINVLFVCHEPSLWGMFDSVYRVMLEDSGFQPQVVAMPYKHNTVTDGHYQESGMFGYLEKTGVNVVAGYDKAKNLWLDPIGLNPDYVFYQTPYPVYPDEWSIESMAIIARICFIPYGALLAKGDIASTVHNEDFMRHTRLVFMECQTSKILFQREFEGRAWYNPQKVIVSGYTKVEAFTNRSTSEAVWKRGVRNDLKRILWTPRWRTTEGTCHFFDYKDFFFTFCSEHESVDFVFRPHPLCFQNFLATGQMSTMELKKFELTYENSTNMTLDRSGDYSDTFMTSDILVSDLSSMMLEYLATGKPVVYTHRIDLFNELGHEMAQGVYWVNNETELKDTLEMLIAGEDPLLQKRQEVVDTMMLSPKGGAAMKIREALLSDFLEGLE